MLKIENLSYSKNGKQILKNISFELEKGEKIVLLGLNGSGKTTLLKLLNALCFGSGGSFVFEGEKVEKKSFTKQFEKSFRQKCSLLFQNYEAMFFCKNIYEDISFSPARFGLSDIEQRVCMAANMFGLEEKLDEFAFNMSGGEKQRAALACIFALSADLILLDEPTSALDPFWSARLVELLEGCQAAVITATHNLSLASEFGRRAIVMSDGEILFDGATDEFLADEELMGAAGFMHSHKHRHNGKTHEHMHLHNLY